MIDSILIECFSMSDYVLNKEQQLAVKYSKGPLLIIAGAGTGKTSVIVEKIKYLVKKRLAKPEQILALTFTEKAASEMEERVDKAMPYGYFQMNISTFHAFADQILKENGFQIGLSPSYRLMTEAETVIFLKKNIFLFKLKYFRPLGNPNKFLEALLQHFSRLRDENITPEEYLKWAKKGHSGEETKSTTPESDSGQARMTDKQEDEKYRELAHAYQTYQKLKLKEGLMDFADLVYYVLRLFKKRPNILKRYQKQYPFVLVDEFQDTNISQYQLVELLCPPKINPQLTVVGDDSQAIYKFRGASISNIINFMKDYKKAKQITLKNNYRSNQTILDHAYKLIKNNDPDTLEFKLGISKNLVANIRDDQKAVNFYLAENVEDESGYISKEIIKLSKTYKYSDLAILVRANNHSEPFVKSLTRAGIPFQFLGPGALYKQPEVKDLIAYLKVLYNLEDSPSLFRLLYMDIYSVDKKDVSLLLTFSRKISLSLFQAMEIYLSFFEKNLSRTEFEIYKPHLPLLRSETKQKLLLIYKIIIKHLGLLKTNTAGQILYYFLEDSGLLLTLTNYKTESQEKIAINISNFFNKLKMFESEHEDASVFAVVDFINMSIEMGESPLISKTDISSLNAVNILTVHSAKGLEFPVVFLVNLTEERFPTRHKKETIGMPEALIKEMLPIGDYHIEEERRLFYVGLTRAKDKAFISSSKFYGEGKRQRKISRFVFETLGEEIVNKQSAIVKEKKSQLSIFDFKTAKLNGLTKKEAFKQKNFSYSQLNSFKTCPLQYKYQYVLRIPTTPTAAESFGITIHKTLQNFYSEFLINKKINKKRLLEIYKKTWTPIGYSSSAHENRIKNEGEKILVNFFLKYHHPNLKILGLEKLFKIKIAENIFLTGKIDRIDNVNKNEVEIIDYKTGKKPSERELIKSLQLTIYALAAHDKNLFNKKFVDINLTFYYLQTQEKITLKKNEEDLIKTKEEVIEMVEEIKRNQFPANPGKHCDFCSFKIICEAWQ